MKERIRRAVISKYGSLTKPNFSFAAQVFEADPYRPIREEIVSEGFSCEDLTDLNNDVSFAYVLRHADSPEVLILRLSMVGPFGLLLWHLGRVENGVRVVSSAMEAHSGLQRRVLEICTVHGIEMLSRSILEEPIDLNLFDTDPENVRLYQALFADDDLLPWGDAAVGAK